MHADDSPRQGNSALDEARTGGDPAFERWQRTAIAAFFRAQARGFAPGHELEDWLAAERELGELAAPAAPVSTAAADVKPPARRARKTAARPDAPANADLPAKASASKKAATVKSGTRTRKTKPGVKAELGGAA